MAKIVFLDVGNSRNTDGLETQHEVSWSIDRVAVQIDIFQFLILNLPVISSLSKNADLNDPEKVNVRKMVGKGENAGN